MKLKQLTELKAGDILLCYSGEKFDVSGRAIAKVTHSKYTHAAICINSETAAESMVKGGVRVIPVRDLVKRYKHLAVFRQPDAWATPAQVTKLNIFINSVVGRKYNSRDAYQIYRDYLLQRSISEMSITQELEAYFEGVLQPLSPHKNKYFCSELVVDCFVATGFLDPSTTFLYKSHKMSPGDLGNDASFGTFYGYLSQNPKYVVPEDDEFINMSSYSEIFDES